MMQNTLFSSVQTGRAVAITAANIVGVMIASRENLALVANYVERILRLEKTDLEAAENVGAPA